MSGNERDRESWRQLVTDTVLGPEFRRATFGGAVRGEAPCPWVRVVIRPLELRGQRHLQFSYFDAKKNITKNHRGEESAAHVREIVDAGFAAVHLETLTEAIDLRTTRKGKILVGRSPLAQPAESLSPHNRTKDVPLPEGRADALLEAMGILTQSGQVRPSRRAKFTQINEFLKHLLHVFEDAGLRDLGRALAILDCGSGSSFLTLAVHHYLNDVLNIPAQVVGVDVNEEVIRKSMERAELLGADRLRFSCSRIGAGGERPDIVLALHACDTATDDAIAQAVAAEARILLCVPCCHHHLNEQFRAEGPAAVLRPLLRHGILRERTADLVTDAFRALALRIVGYRTDIVEFISPEHTARNLMIRAVRGAPPGDSARISEYLEMRRFWGVTPYIETALGERLQTLLAHGKEQKGSGTACRSR
jgi:hypothetical protein